MTDWTPAPLSSPAEDLAAAIELVRNDPTGYRPTPPIEVDFWDRLARLLDRIEARQAHYRRHHPLPLPIDGRDYARRRKAHR